MDFGDAGEDFELRQHAAIALIRDVGLQRVPIERGPIRDRLDDFQQGGALRLHYSSPWPGASTRDGPPRAPRWRWVFPTLSPTPRTNSHIQSATESLPDDRRAGVAARIHIA